MEDPDAGRAALPWIDEEGDVTRQLGALLSSIERPVDDATHFWSIHDDSGFIGLIGLDDRTIHDGSRYNLGYWVRQSHRSRGIARTSVDAIFQWLKEVMGDVRIEITVHPHNTAGLATCHAILRKWDGVAIEGFVSVDIGPRTVPHHLHIIDLTPEVVS